MPETVAICCYLEGGKADGKPCGKPAEWEIYSAPGGLEDNTLACSDHLEELQVDGTNNAVYRFGCRVGPPPETIEPTTQVIISALVMATEKAELEPEKAAVVLAEFRRLMAMLPG